MYKITLLAVACLVAIRANAQIVFEHSYTNIHQGFTLVPIDSGEYKYIDVNYFNIDMTLYNLDHSLYTTIAMPSALVGSLTTYVYYVTKRLFDCDTSQIEYLVQHQDPGTYTVHVSIYREDGTLLFHASDYTIGGGTGGPGFSTFPIYNTPLGAKMILKSDTSSEARIYSLCGLAPLYESPLEPVNTYSNVYPNPASNHITLEYRLPENLHQADLLVYSIDGTLVKQYRVTDDFHNVILSLENLPVGTYTYSIRTPSETLPAGKFLKSN